MIDIWLQRLIGANIDLSAADLSKATKNFKAGNKKWLSFPSYNWILKRSLVKHRTRKFANILRRNI